jgi:hypothetical protein
MDSGRVRTGGDEQAETHEKAKGYFLEFRQCKPFRESGWAWKPGYGLAIWLGSRVLLSHNILQLGNDRLNYES